MPKNRVKSRASSRPSRSGGRKFSSTARIQRYARLNSGNLVVDGSGNVTPATGLGGFGSSGTGIFQITPANLGIAVDFATHFSMWRLNRLVFHYVSDLRLISTFAAAAVPGVCMFAFLDDPGRVPGSAPSSGQLPDSRIFKEVPLDKSFSLVFSPLGPTRWLESSVGATSDSSTLRQASAGAMSFVSTISCTFVSGSVGRIYVEFDISFKGAGQGQTATSFDFETIQPARPVTLLEEKRITHGVAQSTTETKGEQKKTAEKKHVDGGLTEFADWQIDEEDPEWSDFQSWLAYKASQRSATSSAKAATAALKSVDSSAASAKGLSLGPG